MVREKNVFSLEVLHGVLHPEAHNNGLKKNKHSLSHEISKAWAAGVKVDSDNPNPIEDKINLQVTRTSL
jgi:hypothetical protein